ncbi:MAG: glycosyltransferase family 2 protein [Candidatus Shapirobacteria bacterium]|nr:glycosyltransferase family 2 protein [Candidatus Shapirobacteria bacterium]
MKLLLSVIIVNFNTKELLGKCLQSVFSQKKIVDGLEVIVVDNNSTDGSREMLEKFQGKETELKTIFNQNNNGFARAVNQGIKKSQGEYLLLLNSDIFVKPKALENLVDSAKKNSEVGVIGGKLLNPDGSIQGSCFHLPTLLKVMKEFWFKGSSVLSKYTPAGKDPVEVEAVIGAVFLIPREIINKFGLLDERYFMYFEDLDYCRRVRKNGYKIYYLPKAEFIHTHGASGKNISGQTHQWLVESSQIYHGWLKYYLITFIIRTGQKWQKFG